MKMFLTVCAGFACLIFVAACGKSSSTSSAVYGTPVVVAVSAPQMGGAIQGGALSLGVPPSEVLYAAGSSFSGGSAGFTNLTTAGSATYNRPMAVTSDGANLYVADYYNNVIRRINIATRHVDTIAGNPLGLAGSVDGTGTAAAFNRPTGITTDGVNLYVTDSNNFTVRKIVIATGVVTTPAGTAGQAGYTDAPGAAARFNLLYGITTDGNYLYVTDSANTVRMIDKNTWAVLTLAGSPGNSGSADGTRDAARFNYPSKLTTDGPNLYVTDFFNSTVRKIALATGAVTTFAGIVSPGGPSGTRSDSTDGTGKTARFNLPNAITCDGPNLYVTDSVVDPLTNSYIKAVRKIIKQSPVPGDSYSGGVTTLMTLGSSDQSSITGITTDGFSLFAADFDPNAGLRHVIRQLK